MAVLYPKNKAQFKSLVPFARRIIALLRKAGMDPVLHGSFAQFYHTKDTSMDVNDIDILIPKKKAAILRGLLVREGIRFKAFPGGYSLIIRKGRSIVETDPIEDTYVDVQGKMFPRRFDVIDFYGMDVRLMRLDVLERLYEVALAQSVKTRPKVRRRIKALERFLGRKLVWKRQR